MVLGAGAAGLMCAIEAGKRRRRVLVLERAERIGKKILISGGGRCNFTNVYCKAENFVSSNPHFCKSALARYTPVDFIALVEKHGIAYHEKTLGQLFCDGSSSQIVAMLESECREAGVEIQVNEAIESIDWKEKFTVHTGKSIYRSESLVVATGGLSIPKMGATAFGYEVARQFGIAINECRPALVPLTFDPADQKNYCDLSGISAEVVASTDSRNFREKMLITHRGLSGPAILQISSYWKPGQAIEIDLAPEREVLTPLLEPKAKRDLVAAEGALKSVLPARFAKRWIEQHPPAAWTNHALNELERQIHNWSVRPSGTEGYDKAEVTAGGVDTNELSAKTMESRKVSGLFFIGEVVDVTGHLGGFNFQWAWASGYCAGQEV
jgi:predicted Rossmann fold flavoprotein